MSDVGKIQEKSKTKKRSRKYLPGWALFQKRVREGLDEEMKM